MCVTLCFFIVARVTSVEIEEDEENIFGVPAGLQAFFNTGLLGALITTIAASITWQLVASAFPMAFLSTPLTYVLLRFCLFLEWTGLCQGAWVVARIHRKLARFKRDEVYVGTAEERAIHSISPNPSNLHDADYDVKPGHMYPGVPTFPPNFAMRMHTLDDIAELEKDLNNHKSDVENRLRDLEIEKERLMQGDQKA